LNRATEKLGAPDCHEVVMKNALISAKKESKHRHMESENQPLPFTINVIGLVLILQKENYI